MASTKINDFMKEMTEATGLYGEDLFAFIRKKCLPEQPNPKEDVRPIKEIGRFYGNNKEALDYIISLGADENTQQLFKASSPEFRACIMCSVARTHRFEWTAPVHLLTPNMAEKEKVVDKTFIGYWDPDDEIYTF